MLCSALVGCCDTVFTRACGDDTHALRAIAAANAILDSFRSTLGLVVWLHGGEAEASSGALDNDDDDGDHDHDHDDHDDHDNGHHRHHYHLEDDANPMLFDGLAHESVDAALAHARHNGLGWWRGRV